MRGDVARLEGDSQGGPDTGPALVGTDPLGYVDAKQSGRHAVTDDVEGTLPTPGREGCASASEGGTGVPEGGGAEGSESRQLPIPEAD